MGKASGFSFPVMWWGESNNLDSVHVNMSCAASTGLAHYPKWVAGGKIHGSGPDSATEFPNVASVGCCRNVHPTRQPTTSGEKEGARQD